MAAKFKRRPSKVENKLLKLDKLQLCDVLCTICQSIIIEPVTLPCFHDFCLICFNGTIENNALSCPLCRMRIGSWLRTATKQNNLVNSKLWDFVKTKFSHEVATKLKGEEINLPQEKCVLHLSAPGEIRSEYEAELERHRKERQLLEEKNVVQTTLLIKELDEQERRERKVKLEEQLLRDELLAKQLSSREEKFQIAPNTNTSVASETNVKFYSQMVSKQKKGTLDKFILKGNQNKAIYIDSPLMTDDSSGSVTSETTGSSVNTTSPASCDNVAHSPELVSTVSRYNKFVRDYLDRKFRFFSGNVSEKSIINSRKTISSKNIPKTWEPGGCNREDSKAESHCDQKEFCTNQSMPSSSNTSMVHSLPVSIPSSVLLRRHVEHKHFSLNSEVTKVSEPDVTSSSSNSRLQGVDTDSEDSLKQELCYFKPLHSIAGSSRLINSKPQKVLRIPAVRPVRPGAGHEIVNRSNFDSSEYMNGLQQLRCVSEHPISEVSAFVCLIKMTEMQKEIVSKNISTAKNSFKSRKVQQVQAEVQESNQMEHGKNTLDMVNQGDYGNKIEPVGFFTQRDENSKMNLERFENLHISPKKQVAVRRKLLRNDHSDSSSKFRHATASQVNSDHVRTLRSHLTTDEKMITDTNMTTKQTTPKKGISYAQKENAKKDLAVRNNFFTNESPKTKTIYGNELKQQINRLKSVDLDVMDGVSSILSDTSVIEEQRRLEAKMDQEKCDLELALRIQNEWSIGVNRGGYSLRASANKRQVSLLDMMRGAKKMKV